MKHVSTDSINVGTCAADKVQWMFDAPAAFLPKAMQALLLKMLSVDNKTVNSQSLIEFVKLNHTINVAQVPHR
jgi:hypothetical protein